jgi:hypothetical protein
MQEFLGDIVCVWKLKNKPDRIKYCDITEYQSGRVLLNWGTEYAVTGFTHGEDGFFLSMRACKMYVTQKVICEKSLWTKVEPTEET